MQLILTSLPSANISIRLSTSRPFQPDTEESAFLYGKVTHLCHENSSTDMHIRTVDNVLAVRLSWYIYDLEMFKQTHSNKWSILSYTRGRPQASHDF
jgi:hypothetical protein